MEKKKRCGKHAFRLAQSTLSEKAFCKREGIALSTFRYWKANVRIRPNNPILKKAEECDKTL